MTIDIRATQNVKLAHFTVPLSRKAPIFVSQPQLLELLKKDRSDIERQLQQARSLMVRPHRGFCIPHSILQDWTAFLSWVDEAIEHLEQPKIASELENLIRTWQTHRGVILSPGLRWRRRADVIAL